MIQGRGNIIPVLSNVAASIHQFLIENGFEVNWCGFYFVNFDKSALVLANFAVGKPACVRLNLKGDILGVCAQGFLNGTQVVPDVHKVPGHIACDDASQSELVVPLENGNGQVIGVLDIDSPVKGTFDSENQKSANAIAKIEHFIENLGQNPELTNSWSQFLRLFK